MSAPSPVQYARAGELSIAFRTAGDGPVDLVVAPGWVSNVEFAFEEVSGPLYNGLAEFARVIVFDKRGTGLSDRVEGYPTLEDRMDDLRAVLDAVQSSSANIFGASEGGSMSLLFAATYPERVGRLITFGTFAKRVWSEDYPWAPTPEQRQTWIDSIRLDWSGDQDVSKLAPSLMDNDALRARFLSMMRTSASPGMAVRLAELNTHIDIRAILPAIRVPTLILHRVGDQDANVEEGRWIASLIPGALFVELPGSDHLPYLGDVEGVLRQIRSFLTGSSAPTYSDRVLTTLLFTDIVDSTGHVARLGDERWKQVLAEQGTIAKLEIERHRGRLIKFTGDGLLAMFDGPSRGLRCAGAIQSAMRSRGVEVRAGAHTGEVELTHGDVSGVSVHIASRIMGLAGGGEITTSRVVRDLCVGTGIRFESVGEFTLKGLDGATEVLRAYLE